MKRRWLLIALLCVFATASEARTVFVRGSPSCGKWFLDKPTHEQDQANRMWAVGYLSGMAIAGDINFWGTENRNELDSASALLAIDNYCKANPLKHVADAAEAVFKERLNDLPAAEGGFGHTKK